MIYPSCGKRLFNPDVAHLEALRDGGKEREAALKKIFINFVTRFIACYFGGICNLAEFGYLTTKLLLKEQLSVFTVFSLDVLTRRTITRIFSDASDEFLNRISLRKTRFNFRALSVGNESRQKKRREEEKREKK